MTLGGQDMEIILPILNKMAPLFAHHTSQKVHLRRVPKLKFLIDRSFDHVDKISLLFNNLSAPMTADNPIRNENSSQLISKSVVAPQSRKS